MKLLPCVLLGDFGTSKLAETLTTPQQYRWSTTDSTNWNVDLTRAQSLWDRKALRIAPTAATADGDDAMYGTTTDVATEFDLMNSFGNDVNDLTWCTDLACWLYNTDDVYSGGDTDQFKMVLTNGGTDIEVYWPSTFDTTDRWLFIHDTPDTGTFVANGDNVEQWGFHGTAAFTVGSYFYINTFLAYRDNTSADDEDYQSGNGIDLKTSSYIPTGWNKWRVTGNILGDRPIDIARQLHEMETIGLEALQPVRRPSPKYQALMDCGNIKTYLMYQEETLGPRLWAANAAKTITAAVPVIISNVVTEFVAPSKEIISFSFDAYRFAGV